MIIVHYEVYVLEGRGWMLHARFPRTEREAAITEAKELEQSLGIRVKVLRETYYTEDSAFDEAEVYITSGARTADKRPAGGQPAKGKGGAPQRSSASSFSSSGSSSSPARFQAAASQSRRAPPPRKMRSAADIAWFRMVMARLIAISALALACSLLAIKLTPDIIVLVWKMGMNIHVTPSGYNQLLLVVFALTFLMVAVPLAMRFIPTRNPRRQMVLVAPQGPAPTAREREVKKSLNRLANRALAESESEKAQEELEEVEEELPDLPVDDLPPLESGRPDEALPEIRPDPEDEPRPRAEVEDKPKEKVIQASAAAAEALQPIVMRFLNGAVTASKAVAPNLDSYNKFALHLYMAGAVETLCDFKKQDSAKTKLVAQALETLGTRGDLARKFYDKIEEYLMEPRYLGVVQAGRSAMGDFMLGDEAGAHAALKDVFRDWNKKTEKKAQIVTVMFTDMVGSTDLTQARGDAAAQEVVRRHNNIVRSALAQFQGKEIKHTGDGIMASFATSASAVDASVSIQRQVWQHNERMGDVALKLRIGLNAGEPIQEEDDLFGATVQLAARVCAATDPDQILCTPVVKDLAASKGTTVFRSMGEKHLKGFKESITLYEVGWK